MKIYGMITNNYLTIIAASACINYIDNNTFGKTNHINSISKIEEDEFMHMDSFTIKNLEINTLNISAGNYNYNLEIESNDFHNPLIEIPINLIVNDLPCDGISPGDLNYDGQFDVLDIILAVNVILYGSTDECDAILSDLNNDSEINVLDIVSIINLILD